MVSQYINFQNKYYNIYIFVAAGSGGVSEGWTVQKSFVHRLIAKLSPPRNYTSSSLCIAAAGLHIYI